MFGKTFKTGIFESYRLITLMLSVRIMVARHSRSGRIQSHSGDVATAAKQIAAGIGISNLKNVFQALIILKILG